MAADTEPDPVPEQAHPVDPGVRALAQGGQDTGTEGDASRDYDPKAASREAAKYRRRLRETEAERDKAVERAAALERAEVERSVTGEGGLANADDFWLAGVSLDDLRNEDGGLDSEKVEQARDRVLGEHPNWRRQPAPDFGGGVREPAIEDRTPSFGKAMKQALR